MNKKSLLITAAVMIVLGIGSFLFLNGTKPDSVCVTDGTLSSGFVDPDKNNCPISIESYNDISDYNSKPKIGRIIGLLLIVGGVVTGIVAATKKSSPSVKSEE